MCACQCGLIEVGAMKRSSGVAGFRSSRLHELRCQANLSADQLAALSGISPETVRRVEKGDRQPSGRVLRALAAALDTSTEDLAPMSGTPTLKRLRQDKGLTQREIATAVGVSPQMVSQVERGVYGVSRPEQWAAAYGVSRKRWQAAWEAGREERRERAVGRRDRGGIE
ncbi:helix-turn-helix domain-containing protein [Streptomyces platensis]|uniref:helix-turn-helix domain-containing protein n=1 Tax=Streptomyces platensis TaxID=58346 RepID=UPI003318A535